MILKYINDNQEIITRAEYKKLENFYKKETGKDIEFINGVCKEI